VRRDVRRRAVERNGMGSPVAPHPQAASDSHILFSSGPARARSVGSGGVSSSLLLAFWASHHRSQRNGWWRPPATRPNEDGRARQRPSRAQAAPETGATGRCFASARGRDGETGRSQRGPSRPGTSQFSIISLLYSLGAYRRRRPASYLSWRVVRAAQDLGLLLALRAQSWVAKNVVLRLAGFKSVWRS
jgi:hypothetical protein